MLKQMKLLLNYLAKLLSLENARPHLRVLGILKISLAKSNGLCFLRDLWCVCGLKGVETTFIVLLKSTALSRRSSLKKAFLVDHVLQGMKSDPL